MIDLLNEINGKAISILGTEYVFKVVIPDDIKLEHGKYCGFCSWATKIIYVSNLSDYRDVETQNEEAPGILRHEIIHAFLHESGLSENSGAVSSWATNEEMVDFFAIQWPKIQDVFDSLGI